MKQALGKLLTLLLLAAIACRVLTGQWPWQLWAKSERSQAEAQARVHPDRGGSNEAVHDANAARDLLLARLERTG